MSRRIRNLLFTELAVILLGLMSASVRADSDSSASKTILEIEILQPANGGLALDAQKWRQVFEKLDVGVIIRSPMSGEKPGLTETPRGPFRIVRLIGVLDRSGAVVFPGRSFAQTQSLQLKEWLDELRVYGAQGSPQGKPLWGLNEAQFQELRKQLSSPVVEEIHGQTFQEVLNKIPVGGLHIEIHSTAKKLYEDSQNQNFPDELQGLTAGTSLSFLASQMGLGFRPLRTPTGSIQLVMEPLEKVSDLWPIGWPVEEGQPRNLIVPELFKMFETGIESAKLSNVLDAIETRANIRILVDRRAGRAKGLDPDEIQVSYPLKKTAWAYILQSVCRTSRLIESYKQDEAGKAFLYVAPFVPGAPKAAK